MVAPERDEGGGLAAPAALVGRQGGRIRTDGAMVTEGTGGLTTTLLRGPATCRAL